MTEIKETIWKIFLKLNIGSYAITVYTEFHGLWNQQTSMGIPALLCGLWIMTEPLLPWKIKGKGRYGKEDQRARYFSMVLGKCYSLEESAGLFLHLWGSGRCLLLSHLRQRGKQMKSNSLYLTLIGGSREVVFTFSVSSDEGGNEERSLVSQPYWQLCVVSSSAWWDWFS